jgi:hypothetical protein
MKTVAVQQPAGTDKSCAVQRRGILPVPQAGCYARLGIIIVSVTSQYLIASFLTSYLVSSLTPRSWQNGFQVHHSPGCGQFASGRFCSKSDLRL